jgi:hypothetical protein
LLHSIPRQELGMEVLGESELGLLEWRMRACSTRKWSAKSGEPVRGGDVYIGPSQESSCWAKIQNPDKVQGGAGQCLAGTLYELRAFSGRVRQY